MKFAFSQGSGGRVNYGSPGAGTSGHLTGELFNLVTKARMTHIPYKGAGFAVTANIANEVQTSFLSTATAQPHVKAGRLKPLVVVRKTRFAGMPDVPSSVEAGYPDLDSNAWFGLFAPAKTPKPIVERLNRELARVIAGSPDVIRMYERQVMRPVTTTPEQFAQLVREDIERWGPLIKGLGITLD